MEEITSSVDVLLLSAPGGDTTHNMINQSVLEKLGSVGFVVNIARGSLVDEKALIKALQNKVIKGTAQDVFVDLANPSAELYQLDNVILSPHRGSATL